MGRISIEHLGRAINKVRAMSVVEQGRLADAIHRDQPNLLYSVLALQRSGATMDDIGVILRMLLVCYQAMQESGATWPQISEAVQEYNLKRITSRTLESEHLAGHRQLAKIDKSIRAHPEKPLLAFVINEINNTELPVDDETAKHLMLVAMNLVECIAQPTKPARKRKR